MILDVKTCTKCHVEKPLDCFSRNKNRRLGRNDYCKICYTVYRQAYDATNRERILARSKAYRVQNYKTIKAKSQTQDAVDKRRWYALQKHYGVSEDAYEAMLLQQNGVCAACSQPETRELFGKISPLGVDHNHRTNAVRGLLCSTCNSSIGLLDEDPGRIQALLRYLDRWA